MPIKFYSFLKNDIFLFFLLLVLLLAERYILLTGFNFDYVGGDDLIFWQAANDYSHGIFHEPYFYGQNYNFMLESFLAVPFIWSGMPFNYALPLSTSFISLFPFVFFSVVLFRRGYITASMAFLVIPLTLPIEYGMLCSMSRGFVQGLFFSGFFVFPLLDPHKKQSWIIAAFSASLGYIFNPNSVIVAVPVCLYLLLHNYKRFSFYWISLLTLIPILSIEFFAKEFYKVHPNFNTHPMMVLEFNHEWMIKDFSSLDDFYSFFTPLIWSAGWLILPIIFIIGCCLLKKESIKAVCLILFVLFTIASLGVNKVNDSLKHILLPSARMYLGIPLVTGICFLWAQRFFPNDKKYLKPILIVVAMSVFLIKTGLFKTVIQYNTVKMNLGSVALKKVNDLKCDCEKIKTVARNNKIDLVVFVPNWVLNTATMTFYDYGCPLLEKKMPPTVLSDYERRTWVFTGEKARIRKNVLLYGLYLNQEQVKNIPGCKIISTDPDILVFKNNNKRLDSMLRQVHINYSNETN